MPPLCAFKFNPDAAVPGSHSSQPIRDHEGSRGRSSERCPAWPGPRTWVASAFASSIDGALGMHSGSYQDIRSVRPGYADPAVFACVDDEPARVVQGVFPYFAVIRAVTVALAFVVGARDLRGEGAAMAIASRRQCFMPY